MVDMFDNNIISMIASYLEYDRFNLVCDYINEKHRTKVINLIRDLQRTDWIVKAGDMYNIEGYDVDTKLTLLNNQLHSFDDQPAIVWPSGTEHWYKHGKLHRDNDQPAIIWPNNSRHWYRDGWAPAIIRSNCSQFWYVNGIWQEKIEN